jgi:hypothetical protein
MRTTWCNSGRDACGETGGKEGYQEADTGRGPDDQVPSAASPVDLIDKTFAPAVECGGFEQIKKLVNRLAGK